MAKHVINIRPEAVFFQSWKTSSSWLTTESKKIITTHCHLLFNILTDQVIYQTLKSCLKSLLFFHVNKLSHMFNKLLVNTVHTDNRTRTAEI